MKKEIIKLIVEILTLAGLIFFLYFLLRSMI